jgi:mannose-6-phosphate isomerase-like protein (cupin superfamily)
VDAVDLRDLVEFVEGDLVRKPVAETDRLWAQLLCLDRNGEFGPASDPGSDALLTVVAGEAVFFVNRRRSRLKQWGTVLVPAGSEVVVRNASIEPLVVLMVTAPPPTGPREEGT